MDDLDDDKDDDDDGKYDDDDGKYDDNDESENVKGTMWTVTLSRKRKKSEGKVQTI